MNQPKVLLVTKNNILSEKLEGILGENAKLEIVNTIDNAIEKILANGFSLTILDCQMDFPETIMPEDLIKLNYVLCKGLILIGDKSYEKRVKKSIGKSFSELPVWRVDELDINDQLVNTFNKVLDVKIQTHQELFNDIMNDIQSIKSSFFYKVTSIFL